MRPESRLCYILETFMQIPGRYRLSLILPRRHLVDLIFICARGDVKGLSVILNYHSQWSLTIRPNLSATIDCIARYYCSISVVRLGLNEEI